MVKAGDSIPNISLTEKDPGTKVDLQKELASGKGLIIGVPAAFSKFASLKCLSETSIGPHSLTIPRPNLLRLSHPKLHLPRKAQGCR